MMTRLALAVLAVCAPALSACVTTPTPEATGKVLVATDPADATITFVDGSTCQTPCEVTVPVPMAIVVAKAGFKAVREDLTPTDGPTMRYTLEPVGRSRRIDVFDLDEEPGS